MYNDFPKETASLLDTVDRPPYILFDTIKSNMYKGKKPNMELWNRLADIVPQFQTKYGIDGARIDMGHALPSELLEMIISKAKKVDPDFSFIAEELDPANAMKAQENGYNMIIGNGFMMESRVYEGKLKQYVFDTPKQPIPSFACAETHDTPRIAARDGKEPLAKLITALNYFLPAQVPFINSAQEIYETQPMNTGIDCTEQDMYNLYHDDPYNGKLALFDKYQFHYTYDKRWELPIMLEQLKPIRDSFLQEIISRDSFVELKGTYNPVSFIAYSFYNDKNELLMIFANADVYHDIKTNVNIFDLRKISKNIEIDGELLFSTHEQPRKFTQFNDFTNLDIHLSPGELKIVKL